MRMLGTGPDPYVMIGVLPNGTLLTKSTDGYFRERFADLPGEQRASRLEVAANVPMVETFPAYSDIRSDALGHLWVAEFKRPDEDILGKRTGDLDVESVEVWELSR